MSSSPFVVERHIGQVPRKMRPGQRPRREGRLQRCWAHWTVSTHSQLNLNPKVRSFDSSIESKSKSVVYDVPSLGPAVTGEGTLHIVIRYVVCRRCLLPVHPQNSPSRGIQAACGVGPLPRPLANHWCQSSASMNGKTVPTQIKGPGSPRWRPLRRVPWCVSPTSAHVLHRARTSSSMTMT